MPCETITATLTGEDGEVLPRQIGYGGRQNELVWGRGKGSLETIRSYTPREMVYRVRDGKPNVDKFIYPRDLVGEMIRKKAKVMDAMLMTHEGWLDKDIYVNMPGPFYVFIDHTSPFGQIRRQLGGSRCDPGDPSMGSSHAYWASTLRYEEFVEWYAGAEWAFPRMRDLRELMSPPVIMKD